MKETRAEYLPIEKLRPFEGHPFKVTDNEEMEQLTESIRQQGVLNPIMVRPLDTGEYEVISGHRRLHACQKAGIEKIPALIRELDRDEAVIALVDSNLHREHILPSEKAFAYKLKAEALKHQGKRTDLTSVQVAPKLATEQIAEAAKTSKDTVKRYIRLTNLIPNILEMVDKEKIALTPAVEISYLTAEEQYDLLDTMKSEDCTPSLSQALKMRGFSKAGKLSMDVIFSILTEPKANQKEKISFRVDDLRKFFPQDYSALRIQETILQMLHDYQRRQMYERGGR